MSEFASLKLADIHVPPDRLRGIREDYASMFALLIQRGRTLAPIRVRKTPNGKAKYTLVSGGHRLRGAEMAGAGTIDVQIVKAGKTQARAEEIEENLFRYELTALERIQFVAEYRRLFEEEFGEINPKGGRPKNPANLAEFPEPNLLGVIEDSQEGNFYARVLERLGISERSARRLCSIARQLHADLARALIGSEIEDNLSAIDSASRLPADDQENIARLMADETSGNYGAALEILQPKPKVSVQLGFFNKAYDAWGRCNETYKRKFVEANLDQIKKLIAEIEQ